MTGRFLLLERYYFPKKSKTPVRNSRVHAGNVKNFGEGWYPVLAQQAESCGLFVRSSFCFFEVNGTTPTAAFGAARIFARELLADYCNQVSHCS